MDWDPIRFLKMLPFLSLDPPAAKYGLSIFPPLQEGGWWLMAGFFLTASILLWWVRMYRRARAVGMGTHIAWCFASAIWLYLVLGFIRPLLMGCWCEAVPFGVIAHLNWTATFSVRYGNIFYDPFHMLSIVFLWDEYLLQDTPGLAQSNTALPSGEVSAQIVTKRLYEYMMQMSDGIGVNCGYCHNSRAFADWTESTPARWVGYYGITMTRDLNRNFLLPVAGLIPQSRELPGKARMPILPAREAGPQAGNGLVLCATCHHSAPKPLNGADLVRDYPALHGPDIGAGLPSPLSSNR